jgi:hypothetical protein
MADRSVTHSRKDQYGNITALGNPNAAWSVRSSVLVVSDIQSGSHTYYVPWQSGRTEISVVRGPYGPYLRTDRDNTSRNNLDDLPGI